jgi:Na+-driven multidrug efflux pump
MKCGSSWAWQAGARVKSISNLGAKSRTRGNKIAWAAIGCCLSCCGVISLGACLANRKDVYFIYKPGGAQKNL